MNRFERLRLITPTLVSIGIGMLGVVYGAVRELERGMTDVRERLARVETSLKADRAAATRPTAAELMQLRRASEASARWAGSYVRR